MRIELITTGSELLLGFTVNTHINDIARRLAGIGLRLDRHVTVGDQRAEMRAVVAEALARSDCVLITGGLGPTADDCTREVVAELLGRQLVRHDAVVAAIADRFRKRRLRMPDSVNVQALVPVGAQVLPNAHGTAPGLALEHDGKLVILLPGPPRELKPMFESYVLPILKQRDGGSPLDCRVCKVVGLPESIVEEKVAPALSDLRDIELGYCARMGEVEVRVIGKDVAEAERRIRAALGENIFGTGDDRLEEVVVKMLVAARQIVAVAESCTGGLIAHRLTNVSGASEVFLTGLVTYSNESKMRLLGVREETLKAHGAVSEEVCREMAEGCRQRSGTDFALSTTGIAGPTGGTAEKPVGLVYIALATPARTIVQRHMLLCDRETFKFFASQIALDLLRRTLLRTHDDTVIPGKKASVGRAGPSAPRPCRKTLAHGLPLMVRPDETVLFLTLCCQPRGENHLCQTSIAAKLFESIAFRNRRGDWWMFMVLLMPDHLHALVSFPAEKDMKLVVSEWKKFTAREFGIRWQRDFFDHRLRNDESLRAKQEYIHQNPVRAGLVARAEDWHFVWMPGLDDSSRRGGPPRPTNDNK